MLTNEDSITGAEPTAQAQQSITPVLRVRDLEKNFAIGQAGFAISVEQLDVLGGAIVGILGDPSAGKSELLALLSGDETPGRGVVELLGRPINNWPLAQRRTMIGRLFVDDGLYERSTVRENLDLFARLFSLPDATTVVRNIAEQMGLLDRLAVRVNKLPESFRRRIAVARTLLVPARLFLLDEPDLRADVDTQRLVSQQLLARIATTLDPPAFVVTSQDAAWLDSFCHVVYELQQGKIVPCYTPHEENNAAAIKPFKIPAR